MPTITINIAKEFSPLEGGGKSQTGHMWYELDDGHGNKNSFGFAPAPGHEGKPIAPGKIYYNDSNHYQEKYYSRTIEITDEQYYQLMTFGKYPSEYDFIPNYHGATNSCIDFVWKALEVAGINPSGFEGIFWPTLNAYFLDKTIDQSVNSTFSDALSFIQRIDPLSLDLDGDGIETVGANAGITFDFDSDGLKTGTGWVKGDDGFLVLDRNGNGQIDNGSELFGVDTVKANGQKATDGFDALRDFDSNGDGVFDAKDAQFANVRIWQDSNQDGIAQAGELKTLAEHNIVAINLDSTASNQNSNGNLISAIGSFVRGDGSEGTVNANQSLAANLDLASNPFYREFTDPIALDDAAKALPDMKGSGAVRDLREASMLNAELKTLLATYSQAQTREEQMGLLDKLIAEWAKSADYQTFDKRIDALDEGGTDVRFQYSWEAAGAAPTDAQKSTQQLLERIKALEVFNGQNFLRFGKVGTTANSLTLSFGMGTTNGTTTYAIKDGSVVINEDRLGLNAGQAGLLNQAYEALKKSIYDGLLLQTRLKPYVDQIGLSITDAGIALDYSEMTKLFEQTAVTSPLKAFNDALDLSLAWKGDTSSGLAFGQIAVNLFERLSDEDLQKVRQRTEEAGYRFIFGDQSGNALTGSSGNDRIFGGAGNDVLQGGKGVNQLYGGDGDDTLSSDVW
ncbi:calcium-binding protein [Metapseudomonas otitidis]|uniref:calcium-binding protein n=1 Tax=Metapseudomonas otitidis TaxID=319939 RepID=UPI0013F657A3|nr:calcium-binding protein [Pseudomonas otitidis]